LTKELVEVEKWLSEYTIIEKRIDALYKQAKRPHLRDLALKLGPRGDKNMAVDTEQVRVDGGHRPVPWIVDFEKLYPKLGEISDEITDQILACEHELADRRMVVGRADLTNEERLYIEQRYFLGMSVKEMERDGVGRNKLADTKKSALEKIHKSRSIKYATI
jgi:hypothetical protein